MSYEPDPGVEVISPIVDGHRPALGAAAAIGDDFRADR